MSSIRESRRARTSVAILPQLAERYSPRAFANRPVTRDDVTAMFEAARWAPSCFNDQPWRFVAARRGAAGFEAITAALSEGNRTWAPAAALLVVAYARTHREDGQPNRYAWHDVGLATSALITEATARGLGVHAMAGFSGERLAARLPAPDGHEPVAVLAVGHPGDPATLPAPLEARETAPRRRKPLDEVFEELA